jgi:hypothetical protein
MRATRQTTLLNNFPQTNLTEFIQLYPYSNKGIAKTLPAVQTSLQGNYLMKPVRLISMTALALFLGITASSVYAQEEKHPDEQSQTAKQDEHPAKTDEHAAKPEKQAAKPEEHSNTPAKQAPEAKTEEHPQQQTPVARQAAPQRDSEHVTVNKSTTVNKNVTVVNGERRIPNATFTASFGREHTFSVNEITVVSGQPRFQYGGYWLGLGVPWPGGWGYADPTYIEFVDGQYYMFNVRHPGVRVEIVLL